MGAAAIPAVVGGAMGVGALASLVSTGFSIYYQMEARDQAKAQAEQNKEAAEKAAALELQQGATEAGFIRERGSRLIGTQRAGYAASGVDVSQGSALETQKETAYWTERDAQQMRLNAALKAWGYQQQGEQFSSQAAALDTSLGLGIAGSVMGGLGNTAQMAGGAYAKYQDWKIQQLKTDSDILLTGTAPNSFYDSLPKTETPPLIYPDSPIYG